MLSFKIESPSGHGTGFFCYASPDKSLIGLGTARHVVEEENKWQQPIRVSNYTSGYSSLLTATDRVILEDESRDSAVLLFDPGDLQIPENLVPLFPRDTVLRVGAEIGWVGFPAVEPNTLCFFSGVVSAHIRNQTAYLIDGVAIGGVSGGPVFHSLRGEDEPEIFGIITAYAANRTSRETLPGLAVAQDISHIREVLADLNSVKEAAEKKEQLEEELQKPRPPQPDPQQNLDLAPAPRPIVDDQLPPESPTKSQL
jgi:hypothetical protein